MSFFDIKEDVMDLKLTSYGRYLLSLGKFKPEFYAFYDDDIVYDSNWADHVEVQKDIHNRIKEAPRLKVQTSTKTVEEKVTKINKHIRSESTLNEEMDDSEYSVQNFKEKQYATVGMLGTSDNLYDYAPAWSVTFLKGSITGSVPYLTGSHQTVRIPQITTRDLVFHTNASEGVSQDSGDGTDSKTDPCDPESIMLDKDFPDGSFISVEEDYILLNIEELNVEFENENFEIEVFKREKEHKPTGKNTTTVEEFWVPIYFEESLREVDENGILLDEDEREEESSLFMNKIYVSHYLDMLVDDEIPENILCQASSKGQRPGVFSKQTIACPTDDQPAKSISDLYASDFEDEIEFCEDDIES